MRFPLTALCAALTLGGMAHAQSAPATPAAPITPAAPGAPARIDDIQVSQDNGKVSILVKLSQQPSSATITANGDAAVLELDGLSLAKLALTPRPGSMLTRVEAGDHKLTLGGAALSAPTTVIYRNAVLIEAKLAEPALRGTSLLGGAVAAVPPSPAPAPIAPPAPIPVAANPVAPAPVAATPVAAAPLAAPTPAPATAAPATSLESHPADVAVGKPISLTPTPTPKPAEPKKPDQPVSTSLPPVASLVKIDAARCTAAAGGVAKDAWDVKALGDHALCLLDAGKMAEAKASLDQLAAFAPDDWRVALGRAAIDAGKGDASKAEAGYKAAAMLAPDDVRAAIQSRINATPINGAAGH